MNYRRQSQVERGTRADLRFKINRTVVPLHDLIRLGQTDSAAALLGRHRAFERRLVIEDVPGWPRRRSVVRQPEPLHFGGTLEDLQRVAAAVPVPVLCKDFILDELQLLAARAAGASAVLLIARILTANRLRELIAAARRHELGVLVEVHSVDELDGAIAAGAAMVGVNNRDLDSFEVDLASGERGLRAVPRHLVAVSESGIESRADVERLAAAGADLVLVGTALVRLADPRTAVHELCGVPRHPRGMAA